MDKDNQLSPITKLELLERSNELYLLIEEAIDLADSKVSIPYIFCRECSFRDMNNVKVDYLWEEELFTTPEEEGLKYSYIAKYGSQNLLDNMYVLSKIDKEFFSYYYPK